MTRAITKEIETDRAEQLKKRAIQPPRPRGDFEGIAFLNITSMSSVFLHSPPDHLGFMEMKQSEWESPQKKTWA